MESKYTEEIKATMYQIILGNTVAIEVSNDFYDILYESGLFKFKIKYYGNLLKRKIDGYNNKVMSIISSNNIPFLIDATNILYKELSGDITKLRLSFKGVLDKYRVRNAELLAYLETARVMSGMMSNVITNNITALESISVKSNGIASNNNINSTFADFNLNEVFMCIDRLTDLLYTSVGETVDLNKSKECLNGMRIIDIKLADKKRILDIVYRAQSIAGGKETELIKVETKPTETKEITTDKLELLKEHFNAK